MAYVCIFTEDGEEFVTDLINGDDAIPANYYISWGTDGTEAAKSDTGLKAEGTEDREIGVLTQPTASVSQWVATMTCNATGKTIQEYAAFDAITGGICIVRKNIAGVAVEEDDTMQITITLEMS